MPASTTSPRSASCIASPTAPDRCIYAASAGNLSTSQTVISLLRQGLPSGEDESLMRTIAEPTSMFRAAQLVGEAMQLANQTVGKALASIKISGSASILLGGRIGEAPPALFLIYSAGNFIECKPRHALLPDRRDQIWQADARSHHPPANAARRGDEDRLPLVRRGDALEPRASAGRST